MDTVSEIMTKKVVSAHPEMPIESLILLLIDEGIQAVPVVDDHHRPIGMASKSDLVFDDYEWAELRDETFWLQRVAKLPKGFETEGDLYLEELLRSHTVKDIMSTEPLTVRADTGVAEAAKLMGEKHIHGCPVVDANGVLIGIVTSIDVMKWVGRKFCVDAQAQRTTMTGRLQM
jgi:CBS domain-containing protein